MTDSTAILSFFGAQEAPKFKWGLIATASIAIIILQRFRTKNVVELLVTNLSSVGRVAGEPETLETEYDVVIVGGGTAGCVLASRLTEDPSIRVLVLESGQSGMALTASRIPMGFGQIMHTDDCWNYMTKPQEALVGKKSVYWPLGKMLGGGSSMNAMMFHHGSPSDYDEWAANNSDPGSEIWSYKNFIKYFLKFETYVASKEFPDVDVSLRGSGGPIHVGYFGYFSQVTRQFIQSCVNVGIPHVSDINTYRGTLGVSKIMTYINSRGRRVSAESAYLTPKVLSRPNLKVAIRAHVVRILFDKAGEVTRAVGVEFANTQDGPRFQARARKEVILSAGAIHTPQVLMLSGVGQREQLQAHSIPLIHHLPGVGAHLQDHAVLDIRYRDKSKTSPIFRGTTFWVKMTGISYFVRWLLFGTGPLTENVGEAAAFVRSTDPKLFPPGGNFPPVEDHTSGSSGPDLELFVTPVAYAGKDIEVPSGSLWSSHLVLLRPTSHGHVTLRSANPFQKVDVDPQYLRTQQDVNVLLRGLKLLLRINTTPPLLDYIDETEKDSFFDQELHKLDDGKLTEVVKSRIETLYHPCSTARMAPLREGGVVDPHLRVHGIKNLRIVDASVFPNIISGHTTAPVLAIAEQAADLIKDAIAEKIDRF